MRFRRPRGAARRRARRGAGPRSASSTPRRLGSAARLAGDEAGVAGLGRPASGARRGHRTGRRAILGQTALFREGETGYRGEPFFGRVVGQIEDTFIVAHTADEVFFVDQHVAHERVLFERLARRSRCRHARVAGAPFPLPLELAPARRRALRAHESAARAARASSWRDSAAARSSSARCPSLLRAEDLPRLADELAQELDEDAGLGSSPVLDRLSRSSRAAPRSRPTRPSRPEEMAQVLSGPGGDGDALTTARTGGRSSRGSRSGRSSASCAAPGDARVSGVRRPAAPIPVLAIVGPTGVGKTRLAVALGEHWPIEVVSVDSRQVYRGMDIGTAKPTAAERRAVRHHLVDVVEPDDGIRRRALRRRARPRRSRRRGAGALAGAGGRHRALLPRARPGLLPRPPADRAPARRSRPRPGRRVPRLSTGACGRSTPTAATRLHPRDRLRVSRALEVALQTGAPAAKERRRRLERA